MHKHILWMRVIFLICTVLAQSSVVSQQVRSNIKLASNQQLKLILL